MNFAQAKALYERTLPLKGLRKHLDFRPVGGRRSLLRVMKLDEDRYAFAYDYIHTPSGVKYKKPTAEPEEIAQIIYHRNGDLEVGALGEVTRYVGEDRVKVWHGNTACRDLCYQLPASTDWVRKRGQRDYLAVFSDDGTKYWRLSDKSPSDRVLFKLRKRGDKKVYVPVNPIQEYCNVPTKDAKVQVSKVVSEYIDWAGKLWGLLSGDVRGWRYEYIGACECIVKTICDGLEPKVEDLTVVRKYLTHLQEAKWDSDERTYHYIYPYSTWADCKKLLYSKFRKAVLAETDNTERVDIPLGTATYRYTEIEYRRADEHK